MSVYLRFILVQNTVSHISKTECVLFNRNKKEVKFQLLMHTAGVKNDRRHVGFLKKISVNDRHF